MKSLIAAVVIGVIALVIVTMMFINKPEKIVYVDRPVSVQTLPPNQTKTIIEREIVYRPNRSVQVFVAPTAPRTVYYPNNRPSQYCPPIPPHHHPDRRHH